MHGQTENNQTPRIVCTLVHLAFLAGSWWLLLDQVPVEKGLTPRALILLGFGVALFLRIALVHFFLLQRRFDWQELWGVLLALFVYQIGFSWLALPANQPIGWLDISAVALFILGSWLNTGSELQRKVFKKDPAHQGVLFTGGLFRLSRHVNYFGDLIWVSAWAMITRNLWSAGVPVMLGLGFVFFFIPQLSAHLSRRYGEQYRTWAKNSKRLIPGIY